MQTAIIPYEQFAIVSLYNWLTPMRSTTRKLLTKATAFTEAGISRDGNESMRCEMKILNQYFMIFTRVIFDAWIRVVFLKYKCNLPAIFEFKTRRSNDPRNEKPPTYWSFVNNMRISWNSRCIMHSNTEFGLRIDGRLIAPRLIRC